MSFVQRKSFFQKGNASGSALAPFPFHLYMQRVFDEDEFEAIIPEWVYLLSLFKSLYGLLKVMVFAVHYLVEEKNVLRGWNDKRWQLQCFWCTISC
jgi:hypothetical protein